MSGPTVINDGLSGRTARVDPKNRFVTSAVTKSGAVDASLVGETFFMSTGTVNLQNDSNSFLLFIKNNDTADWIVNALQTTYGSTDGVGDYFTSFIIAPTGGTLLTAGIDIPALNLNSGSPKPLQVTLKLGAQGSTATGPFPESLNLIPAGVPFRDFPANPLIIATGTSFAIGFLPPVGNTSMNVNIELVIYREEKK